MSDGPDISIAMLTYNGGELLARALNSIGDQETGMSVELVAVDSGSTDGTVETLREHGATVIEIPNEEFNFGATRDLLYSHCSGNFVVNLSQDAIPALPDWLENLVQPLLADGVCAVSCGASVPDPDRGFRQFPWEKNGYFYFTREMATFRARYGKGVSFANSAVRRSVWEELRFDPIVLGEDFQFQIKLDATDWTRTYPDTAAVLHHHDYDLKKLWARCRDEGAALKQLGCAYTLSDLLFDLLSPGKYIQGLREVKRGSLKNSADWLFLIVRPLAVFLG